ncbi:MAG: helix-turn-helix domain-containing protein [Elusimicrobia bacterium]|nr:helix-turn-helix domain-containing protein [Elusimicrobiota bacterium]
MDKFSLELNQKVQTRQLLQGRLTAAKWIALTEPEVAREVVGLESDELFRELLHGTQGNVPIIKRKRWPASSLHSGFYELHEEIASHPGSAGVEDLLEKKGDLIGLIQRIGRGAFEKYFLYGEEGIPLSKICQRLGISEQEGRQILDLTLEVGARSEFFRPPSASQTSGIRLHCIARIQQDARDPENIYFQFISPHWARGRYEVLYDRLETWKKQRGLSKEEKSKLRHILKNIELLNMRQDTLFQILSRITTVQSAFLLSRLKHRRRPLSLRELARRIGVAPSTVSRAAGTRSVQLPWDEEVPLKNLMTGQRMVVFSILSYWQQQGDLSPQITDEKLMRRLADDFGISVSRRTINAIRHILPNHSS